MDTLHIDGYDITFEHDTPETSIDRFRVTVPKGLVDQTLNSKLVASTKNIKVPGFRPGHVPVTYLRKTYGKQVLPEIINLIVNTCNQAIFKKSDIIPAMDPSLKISSVGMGEDLSFSLEVVALPDFDTSALDAISVERLQANPSDEDLEKALTSIAEDNRGKAPLQKPRPTADGDAVVIDFQGFLDGKEVENTNGSDVLVELGKERFIADFEKALIKRTLGESFKESVTFPDDYPSPTVAGKTLEFSFTIKDIQEQEPPSVDDALAKRLNFASVEDLRKVVKNNLEQEMGNAIEDIESRSILDAIHHQVSFTLPKKMIEIEFNTLWEQYLDAKKNKTLSPEEAALSEPEQRAELKKMAERRVKLALVLTHVSRKHDIGISQEDWAQVIKTHSQQSGQRVELIRQQLQNNPQIEQNMRASLLEKKLLRFLVDRNQTTPVLVNIDDLKKRHAAAQDDTSQENTDDEKKGSKSKSKSSDKASSTSKKSSKTKSANSGEDTTTKKESTKGVSAKKTSNTKATGKSSVKSSVKSPVEKKEKAKPSKTAAKESK